MARMETLLPFGMVALFIAMFALLIVVSSRQLKKARRNLEKLAQQFELPLPETPTGFIARMRIPELGGPSRGRQLRIYNYSTGSGKNRTQWCGLAVGVRNPGRLTLSVAAENLFTRAGRIFGVDDVATGDEAFDRQFYVKSNDAAYVRAAFLPEVRTQIVETWKLGGRGTLKVDGNEVIYAEVGNYASAKICARWPALVDLAYLLADVVEARPAGATT